MAEYDSVVTSIINKFQSRARFGKNKYGTDLDRTDLSVLDWIRHAQEEHMDAILYLEKLAKEIASQSPPPTPPQECVHDVVQDTRDIDPDRSETIEYCTKCEKTF